MVIQLQIEVSGMAMPLPVWLRMVSPHDYRVTCLKSSATPFPCCIEAQQITFEIRPPCPCTVWHLRKNPS